MVAKTIAVTGHAGYIGRILVRGLLEQGYRVVAIDRKSIPIQLFGANRDNLTSYQGDYACDVQFLKEVRRIWRKGDLYGFVHLAADSLIGPSSSDPIPYFLNNVGGSTSMLEFLIRNGIYANFIFTSSAAVYGDRGRAHQISINEAGNPTTSYGWTKLHFEQILAEACRAHGFRASCLRFFNVVGGCGELGQPLDQPHVLTSLIRASVNKKPFVLNGLSYSTRDGSTIRDYVHVNDVCRAIMVQLRMMSSRTSSIDFYNVCTGRGTSLLELATRFENLLDPNLEVKIGDPRQGDPGNLIGDPFDLQPYWMPLDSDLDNILVTAWESYHHQMTNPYLASSYGRD